jgi:hypothetical protein
MERFWGSPALSSVVFKSCDVLSVSRLFILWKYGSLKQGKGYGNPPKSRRAHIVLNIGNTVNFEIFFFGSTAVWIQGLTLARQVLYHLSHSSSLFSVGYFWDRFLWTISPGWLRTVILLTSASWVARITSVSYQYPAKNWNFLKDNMSLEEARWHYGKNEWDHLQYGPELCASWAFVVFPHQQSLLTMPLWMPAVHRIGKMLNLTDHQGNANQNHNEISSHSIYNCYYQKGKK